MVDNLGALVEAAFEQARRSGKSEWWVMALPVLKNRILQLSERTFNEADYGATTFTDLVLAERLSSIVQLDASQRPARVILRNAVARSPEPEFVVRPDLWKAVVDYSSGTSWCWDESERRVTDGEGVPLPTVSADEMRGWRASFAERHSSVESKRSLDTWVESGRGALALPAQVRGDWYSFLRTNVVERLRTWSTSHSIELPTDLTAIRDQRPPRQEEGLRSYVLRVVSQMTADELRVLQLPAAATARLGGPKR